MRRRGALRALRQPNTNTLEPFKAGKEFHGTCMASLIAGAEFGSFPEVGSLTIVTKSWDGHREQQFANIKKDLDRLASDDPVVISISWSECSKMRLEPRSSSSPPDLYDSMKSLADKYRVVFVASAGNGGTFDEVSIFKVCSSYSLLSSHSSVSGAL